MTTTTTTTSRRTTLAAVLAVAASACDRSAPTAAGPTVDVAVGSKTYHLEVAADEATREHGLMERDTLPADGGMVFVFPDARPRGFWMHHTRFDLDIVYLDAGGRVVSVKPMQKYNESTVPSDGPAEYAIELAAGQAKACGVKAGDTVAIPAAVPPGTK